MSFLTPKDAASWVESSEGSEFPIQNLPFGTLIDLDGVGSRPVVRIGEFALDLRTLAAAGLISGSEAKFASLETVLQDGGRSSLAAVRAEVFELLEVGNPKLRDHADLRAAGLVPLADRRLGLPLNPGAFVDFYSGICHASNVGRMFRPDQPPLLPNYRHLPVGYNGRASSVVPSGVPVVRPKGQTKAAAAEGPEFGPCRELDFELEMGYYLAQGCEMGDSISTADAEAHIAGLVLVNDWSARDVQRWEYQPLGPFLSKSFLTSVSPWLVTLDALEPFRIAGQGQDPAPLPHLANGGDAHFDIHLEVTLQSARMIEPVTICRSNTKHLYWSMAQQIAHQTSNGTNVQPGDLYASGTISGETPDSFGSMLELTWRGEKPILLEQTAEERKFLEDGDVVTMKAYGERDGVRIGFGEVTTLVQPARR